MNAAKESVYRERKNKKKCVRTTGDLSKPHSEYINCPSKTEFGKRNNKTHRYIYKLIYISSFEIIKCIKNGSVKIHFPYFSFS